jgi:hypothetical protein
MQQGDMRGMQPNMPGSIIQQQQQFMPQGQQVGQLTHASSSNIVTIGLFKKQYETTCFNGIR